MRYEVVVVRVLLWLFLSAKLSKGQEAKTYPFDASYGCTIIFFPWIWVIIYIILYLLNKCTLCTYSLLAWIWTNYSMFVSVRVVKWASTPGVLAWTTTALHISKTPVSNSTLFVQKEGSWSYSIRLFWNADITDIHVKGYVTDGLSVKLQCSNPSLRLWRVTWSRALSYTKEAASLTWNNTPSTYALSKQALIQLHYFNCKCIYAEH